MKTALVTKSGAKSVYARQQSFKKGPSASMRQEKTTGQMTNLLRRLRRDHDLHEKKNRKVHRRKPVKEKITRNGALYKRTSST